MSIIATVNDLRSKISESELSETLNTTTFNIITHVITGDLPNVKNAENAGDFVEVNGKIYIIVSRTANHRAEFILSWI
jgi:hypothetical protein